MIEVEIDGKKFQVEPGKMIIEVADQADIRIPRFCYHKKLSIAANCRMCLVDVDKSGKPLPACATPVTDGMVVRTLSAKAVDAQKSVMEFLLINHPLDCPICDQGGECELQDVAMGYGKDISRYHEGKRSFNDKSLGSLVSTDMTRCIQCTRCIRFTEEIAGCQELGTMGRGEQTEVGTWIEKSLVTELSGNIIDLCPVGALNSKPFRFRARAWEMESLPTIAAHDCIGSNLHVHRLRQTVMRVAPRENESINETWLSDRDRFSYEAVNSKERLSQPMIKQNGEWQLVDWPIALNHAATRLNEIINKHGAQSIGALLSPSSTTEEAYLLQKLMRTLGSDNIDHRLQAIDFSIQQDMPAFSGLPLSLSELEKQNTIVLIGSHLNHEQPLAAHRVRKAALQGGAIFVLNAMDYDFRFPIEAEQIIKPSAMPEELAGIIKALMTHKVEVPAGIDSLVAKIEPNEFALSLAKALLQDNKKLFVLGAVAQNHPHAGLIYQFTHIIANMTGAKVAIFTPGANATGACLAGAIPHRNIYSKETKGLNIQAMFEAKLPAYILMNVEPGLDTAKPHQANKALEAAEFVMAITPYFCHKVAAQAEVILPSVPFTETSGTFVNIEGKWQSFQAVVTPQGEARPAWKILRVLANLMEVEGFHYQNSLEVLQEIKSQLEAEPGMTPTTSTLPTTLPPKIEGIERLTEWPLYRVDSTVRRAPSLQATVINDSPVAHMSVELANKLQLSADSQVLIKQGEGSAFLGIELSEHLPDDVVYIPAGYGLTADLTSTFGAISLQREES